MVLGNYYLTLERENAVGEGMVFKDTNEALIAYSNGYVHLHTRVAVYAGSLNNETFTEEQKQKLLITTVGKLIFNEILPPSFPYINEPTKFNLEVNTPDKYFVEKGANIREAIQAQELIDPFKKKILGNIIAEVFKRYKITQTSEMLDRMKNLGFRYSTKAGITVGVADIVVLKEKDEILVEAQTKVDTVLKQFRRGLITEEERYDRVISIWSAAKDKIQGKLMESLPRLNHIFMMSDSGARGNASNFTQLAGMRGLMANPSGRIIELSDQIQFP
jgi:DNA-directed RNA polymerase, beta' subunit/160 kD subunit